MSAHDSPAPPTTPPDSRRRWWARVALMVFIAGGVFMFSGHRHVQAEISFAVPTTIYTSSGPINRGQVRELRAAFFVPDEGTAVARTSLTLQHDGPVTPAIRMALPEGSYDCRAVVLTHDGRDAILRGTMDVGSDELIRVPLRSMR